MRQLTVTTKPTKKDYLELKKLYLKFFEETITQDYYDPQNCTERTIRNLKRDINASHLRFWLVKDEQGIPVAFAKARTYCDGIGLFCHIYVSKEYRIMPFNINGTETSIANYLNDQVTEWFTLEDCHTIEIEASKEKPKLHNVLTKKEGFQVVREYNDAYILQKRIGTTSNERHTTHK